jgi:metal-responsive CopG/Arc/MetJ family transcriptional regulator
MSKRINVVLSDETLAVLRRVAPRGGRSRLIDRAVRHYVEARSRRNLRERLREGYLASERLNLELAEEWFPLEEEPWQEARGKQHNG